MLSTLKKLYRKYNINHLQKHLFEKEFSYMKTCRNILDIGCGEGEFLTLSKDKIVGLDNNIDTLRVCRKKGLKVIRGNVTKIPFPDKSFDGVHCSHVIEHLYPEDAYKMLIESGRILKKNGIFVLSTPLFWKGFFEDFTHVKPYYPKAILRYLVNSGAQKTLRNYPYKFTKIALYYRFRPIPIPTKFGTLLGGLLYRYKAHTLSKDAYTLVLKKL